MLWCRQKLAHTFAGGVDAIDDTYGQTALMAAAGGGHAKVVSLLLDSGADADKISYVPTVFFSLSQETPRHVS